MTPCTTSALGGTSSTRERIIFDKPLMIRKSSWSSVHSALITCSLLIAIFPPAPGVLLAEKLSMVRIAPLPKALSKKTLLSALMAVMATAWSLLPRRIPRVPAGGADFSLKRMAFPWRVARNSSPFDRRLPWAGLHRHSSVILFLWSIALLA